MSSAVESITQRHFDSFPSPLSNYRSNFFYSTKKKNKTRSLYTKEGAQISSESSPSCQLLWLMKPSNIETFIRPTQKYNITLWSGVTDASPLPTFNKVSWNKSYIKFILSATLTPPVNVFTSLTMAYVTYVPLRFHPVVIFVLFSSSFHFMYIIAPIQLELSGIVAEIWHFQYTLSLVSRVSSGQIKHFASLATASKLNYEFRIDFEPRLRDTLKGMVPNLLCQTAGGSFGSVIFFNYLNVCFNSSVPIT